MSAPLTGPSLRERPRLEPDVAAGSADATIVGSLLAGRYEIRAPLGRGGMGEVFEAVDRRLGRTVAVKVLRPELAADERFLVRFRREAATAARLSHAGIVAVHDIGEDAGRTFIVMEFVAGRTLADLTHARTASTAERVASIGVAAGRALAHAHHRGIVHRDVSPTNIMVTADGMVKILDFGIARGGSAAVRSTASSRGTLPYLAPEVLQGGRVDARADVYALGTVLTEMAGSVDDASLHAVLTRATAADPGERFPSAASFADALEREAEGETHTRTMPLHERPSRMTAPIVRTATRPLEPASGPPAALEPARGIAVARHGRGRHRSRRAGRIARVAVASSLVAFAIVAALVIAEIVASLSAPQAAASVTGPDEVPAPTGLTASASCDGLFSTGVDLTWSGGAPVRGYEIWRRGVNDGRVLVARVRGVHTEAFRDTDLGVDARYSYRIRAFDGPRVSPWSKAAEVSTPFFCLA
jgi:Protein kinase domain